MITKPTVAKMEARVAAWMGVDRLDWQRPVVNTHHARLGDGYAYSPPETWLPPAYGSDLNLWPAIHERLATVSDFTDPDNIEERFSEALLDIIAEDRRGTERSYNLAVAMMSSTAAQRLRALFAVLDAAK